MKIDLIAEFCQNHNGSREILSRMIDSAVRARFTHGKIQGLYSHELTKRGQFEVPNGAIFRPHEKEMDRLKSLDLSEEDERWFVEECYAKGIIPMITIFTHDGVRRAKTAGFRSIKIASYDCASFPLLDRVAEFAEEIVVSTGATDWTSVVRTASKLRDFQLNGLRIGLLHARTIYPTKSSDVGLARMLSIESLGVRAGFSDHSLINEDGLLATKFAIFLGAHVVERHYTVLPRKDTKDGPVSIDEDQASNISNFASATRADRLKDLQDNIHRLGEYTSITNLEPTEVEKLNATYYRGRVATKYNGTNVFAWEEWPK